MEDVRRQRAARAAVVAWATVGWLLLGAGAMWVLGRIVPAIIPFAMGGVIVLSLRAPVAALEDRRVPRALAVGICYLVMFALLAVLGSFVVPALANQLQAFGKALPGYYDVVQEWWDSVQGQARALVLPEWVRKAIEDLAQTIGSQLTRWASSLAGGLISFGQGAATFLIDLVLAFVIGFWALRDLPKVRDEIMQLVADHRRGEAEMILATVLKVLGGYIRGQLIVSAFTGLLVWIGLAAFGVPYSLVLGILVGLLNVVPYLGPFIGGLVAAVIGVFVAPLTGLAAVGVVLAAQQLTDAFITPRVMSSQVDLHPLLVIFSLLVGGTLFGFWGLVLAIPFAAIAKGLFVYYYEKTTRRVLGTEDGALFKKRVEPRDDDEGNDPADAEEIEARLETNGLEAPGAQAEAAAPTREDAE